MLLRTNFRNYRKKFYLRKFCLIMISLVLISVQINAQNGWTKKANLPTPRAGASASVFKDKIYVIGGYNLSGDLKVNEVYDPLTDTWEIKQLMPTARGYLFTPVINDTIYAMGGGDVIHTNKNEAYDPITNSWTTKANLPYTWNGVYGDTVDEIVYIMGGNYNRQNCFSYNPSANAWTEKTPIPPGGCKGTLSATTFNGLIYTFGGVTNYPDGPMSTVNVYNPNTDTWESKASMPTPRYALRTFLVEGKIYALGGSQGNGNALSTVEVYNPINNTWETLSNMPFKISWFTGAVFDNKIYLFGGTPDWLTAAQEVWEFVPPTLFPQQPVIDKSYAKINTDSVLFRTRFYNLHNLQFTSHLICVNSDNTQIDSLTLFDDGLHGDSLANDGLYGCYIPPRQTEDYFNLSVSTIENQTNKYFNEFVKWRFTTAGPVKLDSITYRKGLANYHYVRPYVHNWGMVKAIKNTSLRLSCNDPWVASLGSGSAAMPNIAPDSSAGISTWITIKTIDSLFPGCFNFKVDVSSDGWTYWVDSMIVNVITGLEDEVSMLSEFKLDQNYPCPFNSSTKISWQTPVSSWQTLKVYDVLGNEVTTLVDGLKPAGTYEVEFNASGLPSGVYFYQLTAGNFVETKKMVLMK